MRTRVMQRFLFALACATISMGLNVASSVAQTPQSDAPLTNAAVVKLVRAGFKEKTVVTIIGSRPANFDMSTERMIELKRSGVSERIILAMLAHQEGSTLSDDFWSDDAFFGREANTASKDPGRSTDPKAGTSTDIFGSSGGSSSSIKSRGGINGSGSGETLTTGSATVRIIRPPSEADAPAKLEKTPSLTNDSIVELVEAGFSEGTIIRRIQSSPVEFNLAPEKVAELRKYRVSDKILSAMKSAMSDEPTLSNPHPGSNGTPK